MSKQKTIETKTDLQPLQTEEEPPAQTLQIETQGYGRFEYQDGTVYQGEWKLFNKQKMKHGFGTLVVSSTLSTENEAKEEYTGNWVEDRMDGEGTYKYKSGAIYIGDWVNNKQHGYGKYQFPDGCVYEGEWADHKMHGEGVFIDSRKNRWEGEFVDGIYQSKMQKQLKMEKMLKKKEQEIIQNCVSFFSKFQQAFSKSDKKTFKENLLPFFPHQEEIKLYVKEPFPKFDDRIPDKWNDVIKKIADFTTINVLRQNTQAKLMDPNNIVAAQFSGIGQIVEFTKQIESRIFELAICNAFEQNWVIVFYHDNQEPEQPPKKK